MTTTTMPPPPSKPSAEEPGISSTSTSTSTTTTTTTIAPMAPPPPKNPNPEASSENPSEDTKEQDKSNSVTQHGSVPYKIPEWSGPPCHNFYFEVLKDGSIVDQFDVCKKGAYMFGRVDLCDFVLEHPTISRFHAVIQFKRSGDAYLYDVGSTHGTFINKNQECDRPPIIRAYNRKGKRGNASPTAQKQLADPNPNQSNQRDNEADLQEGEITLKEEESLRGGHPEN